MNVTPLTKLCERCKRRIKLTSLSCVCGWSAAMNDESHTDYIACCFSGCARPATVRTWTSTGWANVCPEDYTRLEYTKRPTENPHIRQVREAYERSHAFKEKNPNHISQIISVSEEA